MDDLDEEVEQLQRGRRTRPLVHDHLRKVHVIRIHTAVTGPAVPPHVASKSLPRREAQPTRAARVGRHGLVGPVALRRRRRAPPEVARPVAAERLERRELPPARPALEPLPPSPATLVARRRRRACARCCCFLGGRGGRAAGQGEEGRGGGVEARRRSVAVLLFFFFSAMNMEDEIVTGMLHVCWAASY